ncbi:MAG: hypothetical protein Q9165_004159 [Trypethelium subeluteriae]
MGRQANPDIRRAFVEFNDDDTPAKCSKVRCTYCGFVRAKNTTRQIEHLQSCKEYLNSSAAQEAGQSETNGDPANGNTNNHGGSEIFNGTRPNPNLQIQRRGPNGFKRKSDQALASSSSPIPPQSIPRVNMPSLTKHLLSKFNDAFTSATQQPFLSHAGCGTLSSNALSQWLIQDSHYARGYVSFIGSLIAKVRLPFTANSQFHVLYRTMDLLISALNNIRREMSFFEITATKYNLQLHSDSAAATPPNPICRAYLDLFAAAGSPSVTLLEGMVVLWATEHCYRSAWSYAATFGNSLPPPAPTTDNHILALHHALIPNWTAPAFGKFVDACRALVDELAGAESAKAREVQIRSEEQFAQVLWLEEKFWPVVDGMGEERDGEDGGRVGEGGVGS